MPDFDWTKLFDLNTTLGAVVTAAVIFIAAFVISWLLGLILRRQEDRVRRLFFGVDETIFRFLLRLKTLIVFLAALAVIASIIPGLRTLLGSMVAGAGITALVIGFAAKSTLANLISGVSLAFYRPIRIGDSVSIEDHYGQIEEITLRHTVLLTWDQKRVVIPNEKLDSMSLINYSLTDPKVLATVEFGVSYDTDIDLARYMILEEAKDCPHRMPDDLAPTPPEVRVVDWAESSITLRLYMWAPSRDNYWLARFWLLERVKKRFAREGVEIPFPYRTIVYKKEVPPAPQVTPEIIESLEVQRQQAMAAIPPSGPGPPPTGREHALSRFLSRWRKKNAGDPSDK